VNLRTAEDLEAFQFWWHAIVFGSPRLGLRRGEMELRRKLMGISRPAGVDQYSRVLLGPCSVALQEGERLLLLECFGAVTWQAAVAAHVLRAVRLLGATVPPTAGAGVPALG
jgi:hypothetical protein